MNHLSEYRSASIADYLGLPAYWHLATSISARSPLCLVSTAAIELSSAKFIFYLLNGSHVTAGMTPKGVEFREGCDLRRDMGKRHWLPACRTW